MAEFLDWAVLRSTTFDFYLLSPAWKWGRRTQERLLPQPGDAPPALGTSLGPSALFSLCPASSTWMTSLCQGLSPPVLGTTPSVLQQESASWWAVSPECPGLARVPLGGIGNAWPAFKKGFKKETVPKRPQISFDKDIPLPFTYFIFTQSEVTLVNVGCC